jgi:hypothetical protein
MAPLPLVMMVYLRVFVYINTHADFKGKSAQSQYRCKAPYKANPLPENPGAASSSGAPAQNP